VESLYFHLGGRGQKKGILECRMRLKENTGAKARFWGRRWEEGPRGVGSGETKHNKKGGGIELTPKPNRDIKNSPTKPRLRNGGGERSSNIWKLKSERAESAKQ